MSGALLLYAPVPVFAAEIGGLMVEEQALNGLSLWAQHFDRVTVMMPLSTEGAPPGWVALPSDEPSLSKVVIEPLPMAYRPDQFWRVLGQTRRKIGTLIQSHDYLSFAIGGLFGDWGTVAALEADRQKRPFAVWTDRVESEVMRQSAGSGSWRSKLKARLYHRPMWRQECRVIGKAALGLFHGQETFEAYAPYCANPQLVHDIHLSRADHISEAVFAGKVAAAANRPLKLLYVGRADPMKGPHDWVRVLEILARENIPFQASWLGAGSELPKMQRRVIDAGLTDQVTLPGFVEDRSVVRDAMFDADLFLFCHLTPESPRNLIEALTAAAPLVGYDGAYAADLIGDHGGGTLCPVGAVETLAQSVIALDRDRAALVSLMEKARRDGAPFTDQEVFRHRCALIKAHL